MKRTARMEISIRAVLFFTRFYSWCVRIVVSGLVPETCREAAS
jgi:hypothetical protein